MPVLSVAPFVRLPKSLGLLSYQSDENNIVSGAIVRVKVRGKLTAGLVVEEESTYAEKKLKKIEAIFVNLPVLSQEEIKSLKLFADIFGVAHGTLGRLILPEIGSRTKPFTINQRAQETLRNQPIDNFDFLPEEKKLAAQKILEESEFSGTIIAVPSLDGATKLVDFFMENKIKTELWSSSMTTRQKREAWIRLRNGDSRVVIGTRGAVFLPLFDLKKIIIVDEAASEHKQWENRPRMSNGLIARIRQSTEKINITRLGYTPSFSTYQKIFSGEILLKNKPAPPDPKEKIFEKINFRLPKIIDQTEEKKAGHSGILSEQAKEAILESKGDVFLLVGRKGYAPALVCQTCGEINRCEKCGLTRQVSGKQGDKLICGSCRTRQPIPPDCEECGGRNLTMIGSGTGLVAEGLTAFVANHGREGKVYRVDSDIGSPIFNPEESGDRLIVGTEFALPYLRYDKIKLAIIVHLDAQLLAPEMNAIERVFHLIINIGKNLLPEAEYLMQTILKNHLLFKSFGEPERLYRTELSWRKKLQYAPYVEDVRLIGFFENQAEADKEANKLKNHLEQALTLTKMEKKANISHPAESSPEIYRGRVGRILRISFPSQTPLIEIAKLLRLIPEKWTIDPEPRHLLSLP